ncbi:MAG TPA: hypothetical protein DCW90_00300 [Lachnospiraceae bacterium]|nr:hypothetical protein [Lachnospiraceae bacterium]
MNTKILGESTVTIQMFEEYSKRKFSSINLDDPNTKSTFDQLFEYYDIFCKKHGIRTEVALAQMLNEYSADATLDDILKNNNPMNLKSLNNRRNIAAFHNLDDGVLAHIQRLYAMNKPDPVDAFGGNIYDPRVDFIHTENAKDDILRLSGKWSWSDPGYNKKKYPNFEAASKNQDTYGYAVLNTVNDLLSCEMVPVQGIDKYFEKDNKEKNESTEDAEESMMLEEVMGDAIDNFDEESDVEESPIVTEKPITAEIPEATEEEVMQELFSSLKDQANKTAELYFENLMRDLKSMIVQDVKSKSLRLNFYETTDEDDALMFLYNLRAYMSSKNPETYYLPTERLFVVKNFKGTKKYSVQFISDKNHRYSSEYLHKVKQDFKGYVFSKENKEDRMGFDYKHFRIPMMMFY